MSKHEEHVNGLPNMSKHEEYVNQWRSQDIAVARAQHGHTTFVRLPRGHRGSMPSVVGDPGQVLRVLGWAYCWCYSLTAKEADWWLCVEQSCELFSDIRGERWG